MTIGENIKEIRIERNMSQLQLAREVNVTQSMIAQLERGSKTLTVPLGKELAKVLGVSLMELIREEQENKRLFV